MKGSVGNNMRHAGEHNRGGQQHEWRRQARDVSNEHGGVACGAASLDRLGQRCQMLHGGALCRAPKALRLHGWACTRRPGQLAPASVARLQHGSAAAAAGTREHLQASSTQRSLVPHGSREATRTRKSLPASSPRPPHGTTCLVAHISHVQPAQPHEAQQRRERRGGRQVAVAPQVEHLQPRQLEHKRGHLQPIGSHRWAGGQGWRWVGLGGCMMDTVCTFACQREQPAPSALLPPPLTPVKKFSARLSASKLVRPARQGRGLVRSGGMPGSASAASCAGRGPCTSVMPCGVMGTEKRRRLARC